MNLLPAATSDRATVWCRKHDSGRRIQKRKNAQRKEKQAQRTDKKVAKLTEHMAVEQSSQRFRRVSDTLFFFLFYCIL